MGWRGRAVAMVVVVDFLLGVLQMQAAILSFTTIQKKPTPSHIETLGVYIVVVTWPDNKPDDVDTYVQDPEGNIVYFASIGNGAIHLERDDLGAANDQFTGGYTKSNQERAVLRGVGVGEYTVNVQMYQQYTSGPTPVHVALYRLRGSDTEVVSQDVILRYGGDEKTAFRFTLNAKQQVTDINHLQKDLVQSAESDPSNVPPPPQFNPTPTPYGGYGHPEG